MLYCWFTLYWEDVRCIKALINTAVFSQMLLYVFFKSTALEFWYIGLFFSYPFVTREVNIWINWWKDFSNVTGFHILNPFFTSSFFLQIMQFLGIRDTALNQVDLVPKLWELLSENMKSSFLTSWFNRSV